MGRLECILRGGQVTTATFSPTLMCAVLQKGILYIKEIPESPSRTEPLSMSVVTQCLKDKWVIPKKSYYIDINI